MAFVALYLPTFFAIYQNLLMNQFTKNPVTYVFQFFSFDTLITLFCSFLPLSSVCCLIFDVGLRFTFYVFLLPFVVACTLLESSPLGLDVTILSFFESICFRGSLNVNLFQ